MSNPFANWKTADVELHNARVSKRAEEIIVRNLDGEEVAKLTVKCERDLHSQIYDECRRRGWIAFHGSMSARTHRTLGEPDFVVLMDGGRLLMVECKTANGKLSPEQQAMSAHAKKLGHTIHVVRSMEDFFNIL